MPRRDKRMKKLLDNCKYPVMDIRPCQPFYKKGNFNGFCVFIPLFVKGVAGDEVSRRGICPY
jgi:hypothetical protein